MLLLCMRKHEVGVVAEVRKVPRQPAAATANVSGRARIGANAGSDKPRLWAMIVWRIVRTADEVWIAATAYFAKDQI